MAVVHGLEHAELYSLLGAAGKVEERQGDRRVRVRGEARVELELLFL